ncbi:MAG: histidinol dehydrogenase [Acidimicrobiia bacterium]|nr:histidinol dehydrogenase [Acidimicrobiia bacterium]
MQRIDLATISPDDLARVLRRSAVPDPEVRDGATRIVDEVRRGGDVALRSASERYGGGLPDGAVRVSAERIAAAVAAVPAGTLEALRHAADTIRAVHDPQRPVDHTVESVPGVSVTRSWSPLRRVGVYAPGGLAAYPSSLLMGVIPAQVAGVPEIVVASPTGSEGELSDTLLAAADMLGVAEVYAIGGAQAIGALAYGTETIPAVDKIVGPGNAWVTAAKLAVFGVVGIDLPAGPSEALELADATADPTVVAADLISQAEHGPDSVAVLVTPDAAFADAVVAAVDALLPRLQRADIIRASLAEHGLIVTAPSIDAAVDFANRFAPEHLSVQTADPAGDAAAIPAAGSVFLGHWSPHSAGDYATGANHVLPTGGLARAYGPLSVEDYGSWRQVQTLTQDGLAAIRSTVGAVADAEGLTAHRLSVDIRFEAAR